MPDDKNANKDVLEIMKDLQPVAFLVSMCLVIAAFYVNPANNVDKINLTSVLMASVFFFLAYISLFFYKRTNFNLFLYFGECSIVGGASYILYAFSGIIDLIDIMGKETNLINAFYIAVFLNSLSLCVSLYLSGKIRKGKIYNFCKVFFHLGIILFIISIVLFICFYIVFIYLKLQTGIYVLILVWAMAIVRMASLMVSCISFLPMICLYSFERASPWTESLLKFIITNTFGLNIFESLRIIINSFQRIVITLVGFCLASIGLWLLIDNPLILIGEVFFFLICFFLIGFCLVSYREII
jgi:hypothetical protein